MGSDTAQKIEETAGLVTSTEEILDGKLHFLCSVTCEKRQEKVRTQSRDVSYKLKSKLVVFRRNIQHLTGTVM